MENEKMEALLRAALNATPEELSASPALSTGFSQSEQTWEVIVRYTGSLSTLQTEFPSIRFTELLNGYGILWISKSLVSVVADSPQIIYMEKPKQFNYEVFNGKRQSCITNLQNTYPDKLTGKGTLIAIIDSGIDFSHPDFRNPDGTTRIAYLWDQTIMPDASRGWFSPEGYPLGTLFSRDQINLALSEPTLSESQRICPSTDLSGHGTHVAGIAAGNGIASSFVYRGVAYEAELIVVKLGSPQSLGFPNTTQLMQAVDFCIRLGISLQKPLAINLSFGNTYGSHSGTSLLETYLDSVSSISQSCIVVGSGNEGTGSGHTSGTFSTITESGSLLPSLLEPQLVELAIGDYETSLGIQLWKSYWDTINLTIFPPSGNSFQLSTASGIRRLSTGNTQLFVTSAPPSPYSIYQEIYIDFQPAKAIPSSPYLTAGIWRIELTPLEIRDGTWDMWLPSAGLRNQNTRFLTPTPDRTLTIPSTASKVITVGAYNGSTQQPAPFSGRGFTWSTNFIKPDIVAPGVDIVSCAPGGGYTTKTGTSMATPFVTGSCSILMQWGMIDKNDPYLYGEKIKATLIRSSRRLAFTSEYPNEIVGWGRLCLTLPTSSL